MTHALSNYITKAIPIAQKSIAAASISGTYAIVGSTFGVPMVQLIIVSTLDQAVQISLDGTTDFIPVVAGATIALDLRINNIAAPANFGVYVKEIGNPTTGSLYVGGFSS